MGISTSGSTGAEITDGTTHATDAAYGSWIEYSEAGVAYLSHATLDPSDTNAEFISPAIKGQWVNDAKIVAGVHIVVADDTGTDAAGFKIEGSLDGKTWVMIGSELSADLNPEAAANVIHLFTVDLSGYTLPWYRLSMNDDVHDLNTIKFKFLCSGLKPGANAGLSGAEIGGDGTLGIGPDPS